MAVHAALLFSLGLLALGAPTLRQPGVFLPQSARQLSLGACKASSDCVDRDDLNLVCRTGQCTPATLGRTCLTSADCSSFLSCSGGTCRVGAAGARCTMWRQCAPGFTCDGTVCTPGVAGSSCFISYNCADGLTCTALKCAAGVANAACRTDRDCLSGKCRVSIRGPFASAVCTLPPPPPPKPAPPPPAPKPAPPAPKPAPPPPAPKPAAPAPKPAAPAPKPPAAKPAATPETAAPPAPGQAAPAPPKPDAAAPAAPKPDTAAPPAPTPATAPGPESTAKGTGAEPAPDATTAAPGAPAAGAAGADPEPGSEESPGPDAPGAGPETAGDGPAGDTAASGSDSTGAAFPDPTSSPAAAPRNRICIGASSHRAGVPLRGLLRPVHRMQVHPLRALGGAGRVLMHCFEAGGSRLCASASHIVAFRGRLVYMADFCRGRRCSLAMERPLNFKGPCGAHVEFAPGLAATQHAAQDRVVAPHVVARQECALRESNRLLWTLRTL